MPLNRALVWLVVGLVLLLVSSRMLVWGAVYVAQALGVSDLIIGLTIVAIGTSLPELAAGIASVRKNEHDLILGNIIGSGIFNTLAVVGMAAAIEPMAAESTILYRDWSVMAAVTLGLFLMAFGLFGAKRLIRRWEGAVLMAVYIGYTGYLASTVISAARASGVPAL